MTRTRRICFLVTTIDATGTPIGPREPRPAEPAHREDCTMYQLGHRIERTGGGHYTVTGLTWRLDGTLEVSVTERAA